MADFSGLYPLFFEQGFAAVGVARTHGLLHPSLSWANSAICAAYPYTPPTANLEAYTDFGSVAAFAVGSDYHIVLRNKLEEIAQHISSTLGRLSVHVDDSSINERALALRSGIGWLGNNGLLFVPDFGSFIVLGEILIENNINTNTLQIESPCGTCRICINSCPTGALNRDSFNCSRCISYLTQKKGFLDPFHYSYIGSHLYGCDICQTVCPHNRKLFNHTKQSADVSFPPPLLRLSALINMTSAQWFSVVKNSSLGWIGRNTLRRNAIIASGNSGSASSLANIQAALHDPSPTVRVTAEQVVERLCGQ